MQQFHVLVGRIGIATEHNANNFSLVPTQNMELFTFTYGALVTQVTSSTVRPFIHPHDISLHTSAQLPCFVCCCFALPFIVVFLFYFILFYFCCCCCCYCRCCYFFVVTNPFISDLGSDDTSVSAHAQAPPRQSTDSCLAHQRGRHVQVEGRVGRWLGKGAVERVGRY